MNIQRQHSFLLAVLWTCIFEEKMNVYTATTIASFTSGHYKQRYSQRGIKRLLRRKDTANTFALPIGSFAKT